MIHVLIHLIIESSKLSYFEVFSINFHYILSKAFSKSIDNIRLCRFRFLVSNKTSYIRLIGPPIDLPEIKLR